MNGAKLNASIVVPRARGIKCTDWRRERYISTRLNWGKNILEYGKTVAFSFNRPSIAFIDYLSYRQLIDRRLIVDIPTCNNAVFLLKCAWSQIRFLSFKLMLSELKFRHNIVCILFIFFSDSPMKTVPNKAEAEHWCMSEQHCSVSFLNESVFELIIWVNDSMIHS